MLESHGLRFALLGLLDKTEYLHEEQIQNTQLCFKLNALLQTHKGLLSFTVVFPVSVAAWFVSIDSHLSFGT